MSFLSAGRHIEFESTVVRLEGGPGRWHVVTQDAAGHEVDRGFYDAVAICSGAHQAVHVPQIRGLDGFQGQARCGARYMAVARWCIASGRT